MKNGSTSTNIQFPVSKHILKAGYEVYGFMHDHSGNVTYVSQPICMEQVNEGVMPMPMATLTHASATTLMNELWNAGIRPVDVGSPGELSATKAHLADMRTLVFDMMKLKE